MEYESPPEAHADFIRWWSGPVWDSWTRAFYGRRGFFFAWGLLFWLWFFWAGVKFMIWAAGIAVIVVLQFVTAIVDMFTYRWRERAVQREALKPYVGELWDVTPPKRA